MTEDMRERFEKWAKWEDSMEPTRAQSQLYRYPNGYNASGEYYNIYWQVAWAAWQAALSSAGTSGLTRFPCECGRLYLVEGKVIGKNVVNDPLRGDSLSGKGEAPWVCNVCGAAENTEGLFPLCTNGDLHRWAGKALRCVSSSSAGSVESSSTSTTTRNSAEATAIHAISTNTPAGTAAKNSESSAPDRAEELAREISDMFNDRGRNYDNQPTVDELASLLREAEGRCPTCGLTIVPRLCANPACASSAVPTREGG